MKRMVCPCSVVVIPGREANPESRDSGCGPSDHPRMTGESLLRSVRAHPLFLFAQLGRQGVTEIFRRKHLADFDLLAAGERRALHPSDRVIQRFGVDQPEAADEVAGERERTVADATLSTFIPDPRTLCGWIQALARLHHAGLDH